MRTRSNISEAELKAEEKSKAAEELGGTVLSPEQEEEMFGGESERSSEPPPAQEERSYAKGGPVIKASYKGKGPVTAKFAQGGEVFTTRSRFMKEPNIFTAPVNTEKRDYGAKTDKLAKEQGETKVEKAVKPRG